MSINIIKHGKWVPYVPSQADWPSFAPKNALFCRRETDLVDWYKYIGIPEMHKPGTPPPTEPIVTVPIGKFVEGSVKIAVHRHANGKHIVGPATYDLSAVYPANAYFLEITGYTGTTPFDQFNGNIYDVAANTLAPKEVIPRGISRSLIVERLQAAGKLDNLMRYFITHPYEREVWYSNMGFYVNNTMILAALDHINANVDEILAP